MHIKYLTGWIAVTGVVSGREGKGGKVKLFIPFFFFEPVPNVAADPDFDCVVGRPARSRHARLNNSLR